MSRVLLVLCQLSVALTFTSASLLMRMAKALGCVWQDPEAGPEAESEFWRNNAASLAGFVEKLHAPAPRIALGVAAAARSRSYATWRQLEQEVCH